MSIEQTVFARILRGELPSKRLYEDDRCLVIADVRPAAPFHALVLPKTPLASLAEATDAHEALLGHLLVVARRVAEGAGHGGAFRVVSNAGEEAGQTVPYLHVHVLAGRRLSGLG